VISLKAAKAEAALLDKSVLPPPTPAFARIIATVGDKLGL
jgi:hypothetical protein